MPNKQSMTDHFFEDQQKLGSFFGKPSSEFPSLSEVLHKGTLYTLNHRSELTPKLYILTKVSFLEIESVAQSPLIYFEGDIQWVTVTPFQTMDSFGSHYSFRITHRDEDLDFYTSDDEDLDEWMKVFETLSILREIEDDYSIGDVIGSGGQSVVKLGTSSEDASQVAIKTYTKALLRTNHALYKALVSEIGILRELSHPNIVKLYRVYEDNANVYLVMEYVTGTEVFQWIRNNGKFNVSEAKEFMWHLLDVLEYLQSKNIIHRDLKAENLILTNETDKGQFKLIDFGLATRYQDSGVFESCGSPGYIAPEILLKRRHEPKVDIYSAGILFYILLCGYNPFSSASRAETLEKNSKNHISFGPDWTNIDPSLIYMIRTMTNMNPQLRMDAKDIKVYLHLNSISSPSEARRRSSLRVQRLNPTDLMGQISPRQSGAMGKDALFALAAAKEYREKRRSSIDK